MSDWTIGRAPTCAIIVDQPGVSRWHARIRATPSGFVLEDNQSQAGTCVNGQRIHRPTPIQFGDTISLGSYTLSTDQEPIASLFRKYDPKLGGKAPRAASSPSSPSTNTNFLPWIVGGVGLVIAMIIIVMVFAGGGSESTSESKPHGLGITQKGLTNKQLSLASQDIKARFEVNMGSWRGNQDAKWICSASVVKRTAGKLQLATNKHCLALQEMASASQSRRTRVREYSLELRFPSGITKPVLRFAAARIREMDLAKLEVDASGLKEGRDYVVIPALKGSKAKTGEEVIAVGNPHGLSGTQTRGIISALRRWPNEPPFPEGTRVIQTDAAINPGNSGGPLFVKRGKSFYWIGINTIIHSKGQNLGFALHVDEYQEASFQWFDANPTGVAEALTSLMGVNSTSIRP